MSAIDGFSIPHSILRHFDLTATPYNDVFVRNVARRRKTYPQQKLFLDCFLQVAELDGPSLYPPTTPAGFRRLLHSIYTSNLDRLKQDCLLYYILLDYDEVGEANKVNGSTNGANGMEVDQNEDESEAEGSTSALHRANGISESRSEAFSSKRFLPAMWRVFMKGYWCLDRGLWEDGIQLLCDPSILEVSLVASILQLLSSHVSPPSLALDLLNQFFLSTHYVPATPVETDLYLLSQASGSVSVAFAFIRANESPNVRTRLRDVLWSWAFGAPRSPCGKGPHGVQKAAVQEILNLPLLPEEEAHLYNYLAHPPKAITPTALSLLHDMVTLRLLHRGAYAESMQLDRDLAGSGGNEEDRQRRREMVREFISILPEVQRKALHVESEALASQRGKEGGLINGYTRDEEMEADWPDLPSDESTGPADEETVQPGLFGMEVPLHPSADSAIFTGQPAIASPIPARAPSPTKLPPRAASPFLGSPTLPVSAPIATHGSPFAGPPKFTFNSPRAASPMHRVLSGSPFRPPPPSAPSAKPPKRLIDDEQPLRRLPGRRLTKALGRTPSEAPTEISQASQATEGNDIMSPPPAPIQEGADDAIEGTVPPPRRSKRATSSKADMEPTGSTKPPPSTRPPAPTRSAPSRASRATRQSTAPPTLADFPEMPGAFTGLSHPSRPPRASSAVPEARARSTRSASRALLDDGEVDSRPTPKKSRKNAREGSLAPSVASVTRRSTRRGTSVAQGSEMGSPTPSVTSTRGKRGPRATSATPRATRSRQA